MIETNAIPVWNEFEKLETKEMKKALVAGLKGTANALKKGVKTELGIAVQNSYKKTRYGDSLQQGVRTTKVKDMKNFFYCYTTIATNRKKSSSSSFILHFFEQGTAPRYAYIRKGGHARSFRGYIKPKNFFDTALGKFMPNQSKIFNDEIDKAVARINKKKIGK